MLNEHPEVNNHGLNLDYGSWAALNKEILIRDFIRKRRKYYGETGRYYTFEHPFAPNLDEPIYAEERTLAVSALDELADSGYLSRITWLPIRNESITKKILRYIREAIDEIMERLI